MYFTTPTNKSYIIDAHASQQEALQCLVDEVIHRIEDLIPHYQKITMYIIESLCKCIANVVTLTPISNKDVDAMEMSISNLINGEMYRQMGAATWNSASINKLYIHGDDDAISFVYGKI